MSSFLKVAFVVHLLFAASGLCNGDCITIQHPDFNGKEIIASENSTVDVSFELTGDCVYAREQDLRIEVKKTSGSQNLLCLITHKDGECQSFVKDCTCPRDASDPYRLTAAVGTKGNEVWTWAVTSDKESHRIDLPVLFQDKPRFVNITTRPSFNVAPGEDVHLVFPISSYDKTISQCLVQEMTANYTAPCGNPQVIGSPPELMLKASLTGVTPHDSGRYRLTLTNSFGSDHVEFDVIVTEVTTAATTSSPQFETHFASTPFGIFLISANAGIVAAICFRMFVKHRRSLCCTRRRTRPIRVNERIQMRQNPDRPPLHVARAAQPDRDAAMRQSDETSSSNTYESVSDDESSVEGGTFLHVVNEETESGDDESYLHPVASGENLN